MHICQFEVEFGLSYVQPWTEKHCSHHRQTSQNAPIPLRLKALILLRLKAIIPLRLKAIIPLCLKAIILLRLKALIPLHLESSYFTKAHSCHSAQQTD